MFSNKKAACKRDDIPFELAFNDIAWPAQCPVLGIELDYRRGVKGGRASPHSPSFDRIDPALGYVSGNVIIVSNRANTIKSNAAPRELFSVWNFYAKLKAARERE